jgi:hypothetical protein
MLEQIKTHKIILLQIVVIGLFYGFFAFDLERSDFIKLITLYGALFFLSYKVIQLTGGNLNSNQFWSLAIIGILFRLIFIGALPNLSQDFYRFIWDGRLVFKGFNPYLFTPESFIGKNLFPEGKILLSQAQELYNGMGPLNGSHYSNYPPINQLCFAIAALFAEKNILGSVVIMRILIILADIGILYFGRKLLINLGQAPDKIFWYFLNPFIIIELTGNIHFEGVMLFFLVWALYLLHSQKWVWAAVLIGVSVSVKLIPLLFLPLFFQRFLKTEKRGILKLLLFFSIVIGTVILTFLPFYSSQFVSNFMGTISLWFQNFEFNASIYYIIRWIGFKAVGWNIIETTGKILPLLVLLFILILTFFRKNKNTQQLLNAMLLAIAFYYLLSTTVHPWYIATPLLLALFTKYKFPIIWSAVIMLSYSAYGINGFSENLWIVSLEYLIVISFAIWEMYPNKKSVLYK